MSSVKVESTPAPLTNSYGSVSKSSLRTPDNMGLSNGGFSVHQLENSLIKDKNSKGTTSLIRKKLKFDDVILWKRFSARRLQLVEQLSLGSKKASEQNSSIKICAVTLLKEFNYPDSYLPDFDKLVRLAIQSVRRNRKRSEKRSSRKRSRNNSNHSSSGEGKSGRGHGKEFSCSSSNSNSMGEEDDEDEETDNEYDEYDRTTASVEASMDNNNTSPTFMNDIVNTGDSNTQHVASNEAYTYRNSESHSGNEQDESNSKLAINTLISNELNPSTSSNVLNNSRSNTFLPSIRQIDFNGNGGFSSDNGNSKGINGKNSTNSNIYNSIPTKDFLGDSKYTASKNYILSYIKKSKTCFTLSDSTNGGLTGFGSFENIEILGNSCILASISMTFERWFDKLSPASSSYIRIKLNSDKTLSKLFRSLNNGDDENDEVSRLSDYVATQCFKKLIGGCVKDFGFNTIMYPLCDIFHVILNVDYPLVNNKSKDSKDVDATRSDLMPLLFNGSTGSVDIEQQQQQLQQSDVKPFDIASMAATSSTLPYDDYRQPPKSLSPSNTSQPMSSVSPVITTTLPPVSTLPSIKSEISHYTPPNNTSLAVELKFNDNITSFTFPSHSCSPPTLLELISNGKTLFNILSNRVLVLKDLDSEKIITLDSQLEKIFNNGKQKVQFELVYASNNPNPPSITVPKFVYENSRPMKTTNSSSSTSSSSSIKSPKQNISPIGTTGNIIPSIATLQPPPPTSNSAESAAAKALLSMLPPIKSALPSLPNIPNGDSNLTALGSRNPIFQPLL